MLKAAADLSVKMTSSDILRAQCQVPRDPTVLYENMLKARNHVPTKNEGTKTHTISRRRRALQKASSTFSCSSLSTYSRVSKYSRRLVGVNSSHHIHSLVYSLST